LSNGHGTRQKEWLEESSIPSAVAATFKGKFADATDTKWRLSKKGNYKAHYKKGDDKVEVTLAPDGTWKNTRTKLGTANIPSSITSYIGSNYADYETKKVVIHDNAGKEMKYMAHLKKEGDKKKLVFDKDGTFSKEKKSKKGKGKGKMAADDDDSERK